MPKELVKEIDSAVESGMYSTRSEFLKDSAREKVKEFNLEQAVKRLEEGRGYFKKIGKKVTDEDIEKGEKIAEKIIFGD